MNNGQEQSPQTPPANFLNLHGLFHKLVIDFLLISFGLLLGVSLSFYLKDISFNFQLNRSSFATSKFSPPPPPPPPQTFTPLPPPPILSPHPPPPPGPPISFTVPPSNQTNKPMHVDLKEFLGPPKPMHNMNDKELLQRASMVPRTNELPFKQTPKVAFLFLTRGPLPFAPLWERFFQGHEGLYSIYVHSNPKSKDNTSQESVFYGRRIPSKAVQWGKNNMIEAERRLLANALLDISNQRFVLLSESGIPLFNFTTIYNYLIQSKKSFIQAYDSPGPTCRGRYRKRMQPLITVKQWRKGSQWFEMDRELAAEVVSDQTYFPVFSRYCKGSCYSDEHYLPTFVSIKFWRKNSNRTVMWTDWSKGGAHPTKYRRSDVTVEFLERLRHSSRKCIYNGRKTNLCFLFARKFDPDALFRLLFLASKVMQF